MSKSRHTEAQMIGALKQVEAGRKAEDVAREVGVSKHTIYAWKAKYCGMDVSEFAGGPFKPFFGSSGASKPRAPALRRSFMLAVSSPLSGENSSAISSSLFSFSNCARSPIKAAAIPSYNSQTRDWVKTDLPTLPCRKP